MYHCKIILVDDTIVPSILYFIAFIRFILDISIKMWMNIVLYFFNKFYLITFFLNCLYMHLCTSRSNWNRYRKELTWQKTILTHVENKYFMLINEEIFSFSGKEFVMLRSVVYCERSCSLLVNAVLYLG